MNKKARPTKAASTPSGLDQFLRAGLVEDPEFKALFQKELKKLPADRARRVSRGLGLDYHHR